ncbi:MAG: trigger factor [Candidatus Eiseniibacteriota bacterium]|nr:MAG: trigger factor [Candidatus Eisenbacteria bacterium]
MKVQVEEGTQWKRTLSIEIPPEKVSSEMEAVVKEYRKRLAIPGFRKGHAPLGLVQAQLGSGLDAEFLQRVVPRAYQEALTELNLSPVSDPTFEDIKFKRGEALSFRATLEVKPKIEVSGYKGLGLEKVEFDISDEDVDAALEQLRKGNPEFNPVDREARDGDLVIIDYERLGKPPGSGKGSKIERYPVILGERSIIEDIETSLRGARAGEQKKVVVTFPEDHADEKLAGTTANFRIDIKEIREKKEAVLDDEFAKRVGAPGGLDELKSRIRLELEGKAVMRSQELLETKLFDELISINNFELPESMVERMLGYFVSRQSADSSPEDEAELREGLKPSAARYLRRHLIIEQVSSQEALAVTDEDVENEISRIASFEKVTPDEAKDRLKAEGGLERVRDALLERKVIDFLVSQATVKVVKRSLKEAEGK